MSDAYIPTIHEHLLGSETRVIKTPSFETRIITVANDKLPMISMHGGGGHAEAFARTIVPLSEFVRPIAPDFIWHGKSSKPKFWPNDPTIKKHWLKQFTYQILELMDTLGIEKAVVEGESLGGWIAMDLAVNHGDRVAGLVLNTSWGQKLSNVHESASDLDALRETSVRALTELSLENIRERIKWLMPLGGWTEEIVRVRQRMWSDPETNAALRKYYDHLFAPNIAEYYHTESRLSTIKAKTLVMWTDSNPAHGLDYGRRFTEVIPNSELVVMEGCAHWPQWERPDAYLEAVRDFVTKL